MSTHQEKLSSAIKLRESEKHQEARQLLAELHSEFPEDPQVNDGSLLPCTWTHDLLGLEGEAISFCEKSTQTALNGKDLKSPWLGMGSTYRRLGKYQMSMEAFRHALTLFPDSHEFNVFLGMANYNIGEHSKAMEILPNSLADTSSSQDTLRYQCAIRFCSDKFDQIW